MATLLRNFMEKECKLSTGSVIAFADVLNFYSRLRSLRETRPELLEAIRDFCLDQLPEETREQAIIEMKNEKLLDADGTMWPYRREVVLASLRGYGNNLVVESPFVTPVDQALFDLIESQNMLRAYLPQEVADQLIMESISSLSANLSGHIRRLRRDHPGSDMGTPG